MATPIFCYEMEVASLFNTELLLVHVSGCEERLFRMYFGYIRDGKSAVATILLLKTYQNWFLFCHLPCSLKIVLNVFAFL